MCHRYYYYNADAIFYNYITVKHSIDIVSEIYGNDGSANSFARLLFTTLCECELRGKSFHSTFRLICFI